MDAAEVKTKFGFVGITAYIVGIIIGSGIFITSNNIFSSVGCWGGTLLLWTLCGFLTILGALSWAELAAYHPRQGGTYIYILEELGHYPAFLYIITRVILLNPASSAVNALASAKQLQEAFSSCSSDGSSQLLAICLLLLMTWLQSFHATLTSSLNTAITATKILTLSGIFISALVYLGMNGLNPLPPFFQDISREPISWVNAFNGCYWSFSGWQSIPAVMEEIKDPKRTFPRAVVAGVGAVTLVYVLTNLAFILVLSPAQIKSSTFIVSSFASSVSGASLSVPFSILVFVSLFGSFLAMGLVSGRYAFSAAREGDLPSLLSLLHWELNTPIPAQAFHMVLTLTMILSTNSISVLLNLFVFVTIAFDLLVLACLFKIKYRMWNEKSENFSVPVAIPAVYSTFILAMFVMSFTKGFDLLLLVPALFLGGLSILYVIIMKQRLMTVNLARLNAFLCTTFLLLPPAAQKTN